MLTRALKRSVGRLLIGVLLAAQCMVAAYACPGSARSVDRAGAGSEVQEAALMVDCEQMAGMGNPDTATPNLCHEHCQQGQQSDLTATAGMVAAAAGGFYVVAPTPTLRVQRLSRGTSADRLVAASPPHAILHCCSRV